MSKRVHISRSKGAGNTFAKASRNVLVTLPFASQLQTGSKKALPGKQSYPVEEVLVTLTQ
ncbi:hypothetical protein P9597_10695 [Aneurinibacillus migulanus]|uniref:hypothetical protein n=1 Tax=Aneurinibacillus migulanus TaxID=47500 RepID=UPI002E2364AE|nr:hypothetical protein [Aneurinibacillus migulanus]